MSRTTVLGITFPAADLRPYHSKSCEVRFLNPGIIATIPLAVDILGLQLFPRVNDVRFALDQAPEESLVQTADGLSSATLAPGAIAKANQWTRRTIPQDSITHTLYVMSLAQNTTVDVEVF